MSHHHVIFHPGPKPKPAPHHGCAPKHDDPCKRHLKKHHCNPPHHHHKKKHHC